jgi:hypothetical protein
MDFDCDEGCDDIAGLVYANIIPQIHGKLKSMETRRTPSIL